MGEGIDHEIVKSFAQILGLLAFAYLVLRPVILDKVRESQSRIKRLDGRKDEE